MTEETTGTILVAVDGSQTARNAANVAVRLARMQGYGIRGLYVVDETLALEAYSDYQRELTFKVDPDEDVEPIAQMEAQGALALDQVEVMCKEASVPFEGELLLGSITDMILDRAQNAMLIAMGRRGNRHAGQPDRLGDHFWQVVHKAPVPIIASGDVIPEHVRRLLFVSTGDETSLKALHGAAILQRDLEAEVIVALAGNPNEEEAQQRQEQVLARIPKEDRPHYHFVRHPAKKAEAIVAVAQDQQADLIVMSAHRRRLALLDEWLGSPLDKVLQETQLPVIIVR